MILKLIRVFNLNYSIHAAITLDYIGYGNRFLLIFGSDRIADNLFFSGSDRIADTNYRQIFGADRTSDKKYFCFFGSDRYRINNISKNSDWIG